MNVPLCVIAGIITYMEVEKQKVEEGTKHVDYLGILTVSVSLVSLMYALNMSTTWGWVSYKTISLLILFAVVMVVFVRLERRTEEALIPEDVMSNLPFMLNATTMFTVIPALFGLLLYMPQYFEKFFGYSPLLSGASLLPMLLAFAITCPVSGKVDNRIGTLYTIFTGMVLIFIGTVLIIIFGFGGGFYGFLPGLVISGIGFGFAVPSITTAAVGSVRESRASLAGGIVYMFQLVGGALGLAIVTTIFTDVVQGDVAHRISSAGLVLSEKHQADFLDFVLGSGSKATLLGDFGASKLSDLMPHIQHSYVKGLKYGLGLAAVIVALGAVIAISPIGRMRKTGSA